jgi:hypothetical protein
LSRFLLQPVSTAEGYGAAAHDGDPSDVEVMLDDEHIGACIARRNTGGET